MSGRRFDVVLYLTLPGTGSRQVWQGAHGPDLRGRGLVTASLVGEGALGPADAQALRPDAAATVTAALRANQASQARVVLDVRRQDRFMEYAHLDDVRAGGSVLFVDQFPRPEDPVLDWGELVGRIAAVSGVVEVVVRPVEAFADRPERLAADLLRLAEVTDLAPIATPRPPTYSTRGVRVARALNAQLVSDAERSLVRDFVAANFAGPTGGNQFLREDLRARILAAYAELNRKLFRTWLPDLPEDAYLDDERTATLAARARDSGSSVHTQGESDREQRGQA